MRPLLIWQTATPVVISFYERIIRPSIFALKWPQQGVSPIDAPQDKSKAEFEICAIMRVRPTPLAVTVTEEELTKRARQLVSDSVRKLLSRHGVADASQQMATLMTLLGASHSQIYRKLSGRSSWLEEDLLRIAEHHGETLETLFQHQAAPAGTRGGVLSSASGAEQPGQQASVAISGHEATCRVWLADVDGARAPRANALVLIETARGATVIWADEVPAGARPLGVVERLMLDFGTPSAGGIAVFDDDPDVAESIADNLMVRGEDAQAFFTTQDLRASPRRFDVYIIDWFSSDTSTAADLIQYLRTEHAPDSTIVVLTGQIQREHTESDLAQLIHTHNVMVELKPMRVDLLLAKVKHLRQI